MFSYLANRLYRNKAWPDKETLFKKSFPNRPYDDLLLRATMSDLRELVEEFLMWQEMRSDRVKSKLSLAIVFRQRNLSYFFKRNLNKLEKELTQAKIQNTDYWQKKLEVQSEMVKFQTQTIRAAELPLQEISNSIDTLYLAQKLRHACTQITHQAVYKKEYEFGLLPNVIDEVEQKGFLEIPAIALYYYCYRFLTEKSGVSFFQQFIKELFTNGHHFPDSELKNLYLLAINFCIRQLNEGNTPFVKEGWELYQEGLKQGFLLDHGRLSGFSFNNVIAFGIRLNLFDKVRQFIQKYKTHLDPSQRESYISFNLARLEYTQGNHTAALRLLQTADFKDLVNNLIAKTYQLKIFYELDEYNLLDSHLSSFRHFIRRREVSDYHRINYLNIIGFVRKLIALPPEDHTAKKSLRKEIEQEEILTERTWLLEQLG